MIGYALIFLTLFSFICDFFIQNYQFQKVSQLYNHEQYERYVHTKRPDMLYGFNLRSLVQPIHEHHPELCEIFKRLVFDVYKTSSVYYDGLEEDLLNLFQESLSFKKEENKHHLSSLSDLNTLSYPKRLEKAYPFLIRGSKVEKDDYGYPSLYTFLYLKDNMSRKEVFNLFDVPTEIIRAMFGQDVEEDLKVQRKAWINQTTREQERQITENFLTRNRLHTHSYKDLISFKFRFSETE